MCAVFVVVIVTTTSATTTSAIINEYDGEDGDDDVEDKVPP